MTYMKLPIVAAEVAIKMTVISEIYEVPRDGVRGGQGRENVQKDHLLVHAGSQ